MKQVRKGMKLAANYIYMKKAQPIASMEEFEQQQIRDLYIRDQIFNIGDEVDYVKEDIRGKVQRKGTNYIVLEDSNNNLHKAWIWDCIPVAADREADMREVNLNVDYGFEAVPEIQEDLDAQPQDKDVKKIILLICVFIFLLIIFDLSHSVKVSFYHGLIFFGITRVQGSIQGI